MAEHQYLLCTSKVKYASRFPTGVVIVKAVSSVITDQCFKLMNHVNCIFSPNVTSDGINNSHKISPPSFGLTLLSQNYKRATVARHGLDYVNGWKFQCSVQNVTLCKSGLEKHQTVILINCFLCALSLETGIRYLMQERCLFSKMLKHVFKVYALVVNLTILISLNCRISFKVSYRRVS